VCVSYSNNNAHQGAVSQFVRPLSHLEAVGVARSLLRRLACLSFASVALPEGEGLLVALSSYCEGWGEVEVLEKLKW